MLITTITLAALAVAGIWAVTKKEIDTHATVNASWNQTLENHKTLNNLTR